MDNFNLRDYLYNNPLHENYTTEVRDAWPTLSYDDRIDLLTSVWDDPDEAEKHFEKDFADLPEVAKANMRMDMLREVDVARESNPVVNQYVQDLVDYFDTHHDDIYDMIQFIKALDIVKSQVTDIKDRFAEKTGFGDEEIE